MIYAIIGLVFGIIGGILTPGFVPKVYAPYFSWIPPSGDYARRWRETTITWCSCQAFLLILCCLFFSAMRAS